MSDQHARAAPSNLPRTVQCPGNIVMQEKYPEAEGPEAMEGTAAHWVMAEWSGGRVFDISEIAPNGVALTEEMFEGASMVADYVASIRGGLAQPLYEQRTPIARIHADCWGTPDIQIWSAPRHLHVIDYKFGHGFVEVVENWQLMAYAAGVIDAPTPTHPGGHDDQALTVSLTVIQPRSYHRDGPIRTWAINGADLRPFINIASGAVHEALGPDPRLRTGPECRNCTARAACPANQAAGLGIVDYAGKAVPLDLPTDAAANELRRLDYAAEQLEARRTGLQAQLLSAARAGQRVPFYHVEHGLGREVFKVPVDQVLALGSMYGIDLQKPASVTPAQARKLGVDTEGFTMRGQGAASLKLDSPYTTARIFGGIKR